MLLGARQTMWGGGAAPRPTPAYWGLCFTAEQANSTVAMTAHGSAPSVNLLYSTDAANWSPFVVGTTTVTLASVGDKVWIKAGSGGNTAFGSGASDYNTFALSGLVAASGSIMSLLDGDQETYTLNADYTFCGLFIDCTSLTVAPELPATTITDSCYRTMFRGCTSLTSAPEELPATTLAITCYLQMFYGCTSLNSAPKLPASDLANSCYGTMFRYCSHLSSIEVGMTAFVSTSMANWVNGVAATGTFYCPTALGTNATITRGNSACPKGWTVVNI